MAPRQQRQAAVASVCLLLSVALFVANSELMQAEAAAAVPPFFMIWLCHSAMASFLLLTAGRAGITKLRALSRAAFALSCGTMLANYIFVVALRMASVTVVNAIYMGSVGPTYLLSVALLDEQPSRPKQLAVCLVLGGIALMASGPDPSSDTSGGPPIGSRSVGVALAVVSSVTVAVYKVLFKHIVGDVTTTVETLRVLGAMGLCHLICLWPGVILLHVTGLEVLPLPTALPTAATASLWQVRGLGANVVLALAVNLLSTHAMNLTTPVFTGAGMALSIPASVVADVVLHGGAVSSGIQWAGMVCILAGFLGLVKASGGSSGDHMDQESAEGKQSAA